MRRFNYIIVGSGIAGLYTALLANQNGSVLVLTKGNIEDCNTRHAQGGIAAAIGKNDSPDVHFRDTLNAGAGLCNEEAVRILVEEAPDRISDLVNFGVPFDTLNGAIALTMEAAHSVSRILHAGGDATGAHIEETLSRQARSRKIHLLEDCLATDILIDEGRVKGVRALDIRTGTVEELECDFLILACGGAGQLYKFNTNSEVATGDGIALAYRAGAEITDMEFFQFHPTALRLPGVSPFLISEAVRGEGGILRNVDGERFMYNYAPEGELAPRDVVARSIVYEMTRTRSDRVFMDVTHIAPKVITTRFPHIYQFCLDHGLDITKGLISVAPAAHYQMGGIRTNIWGETNIEGLYAVGEVACTGVHGANRLASNSMMEVMVFSKRAIDRTCQKDRGKTVPSMEMNYTIKSMKERAPVDSPARLSRAALQAMMWEKVGILRNYQKLTEAAEMLATWQTSIPEPGDLPSWELYNMIIASRLITEAALIREESRGAHFRDDFPERSDGWRKHVIFTNQ